MSYVATELGDIPEMDLIITLKQENSDDKSWVMSREGVYVGTQYPEARGRVVRRDVWVTMKTGMAAQAVSEL